MKKYIKYELLIKDKKKYFKAFYLMNSYSINELSMIFNLSPKTIYKYLQIIKNEIQEEIKLKGGILSSNDIQIYIDYISKNVYDDNLNDKEYKRTVINIIRLLENDFEVVIFDRNPMKLKNLGIEISAKQKLLMKKEINENQNIRS